MRPLTITVLSLMLFVPCCVGLSSADVVPTEDAQVRRAVGHYLSGHATGDPEQFEKVFHSEAKLFFVREGAFSQRTSAEYIAGAKGTPPADESKRKRWIESVDLAGNAAVAKVILDYPTGKFTDYLSLLKIDGEWKIVNKIFYIEPKAAK